ncbi:MAG: helix-turn-helix domain-containing protein [Paraprevotella sp.]|nr:helix-turn-helix domain-containing protein [Paraprevotella sp.]
MREKLLLFCSFILLFLCRPTAAQPEWRALSTRQGLGSDCIMDAAQDRLGRIWLATAGGLSLYDGNGIQTFTRSRIPETGSIIANDLNKVWPDPQNPVIWIATQRDGLDAFDYRNGIFTHYRADGRPGCIVDNSVTSIAPSRAGGIWLTSYMGGISHYNRPTDDFTLLNRRSLKGLVSDAMWCVLETGDSLLYTGHVRNGLSCIDLRTRRARNVPVISCFPDDSPAEDGVRALAQDTQGRIWAGTEKGLACLAPHGKRPVPVPGIRGLVCHLHPAHDTLWISTRDMGLWALSLADVRLSANEEELTFRRKDALRPVALPCFSAGETALVRCALPDRFGNLWVGTDRKGAQVRLHEPSMFRYEAGPSAVQALERDRQGRIWAGTQSDGIVVTTPEGGTQTLDITNSRLGSNSVTALRRTPDGDIWIGTEMQGLYRWNHRDGIIRRVNLTAGDGGKTIYVRSLACWNGRLAAGTYQGLFLIDPATGTSACYDATNSPLTEQYIASLLPDSRGDLWCGSALGGLAVLRPDMSLRWRISRREGLPDKGVTCMLEDSIGNVWAATEDGLAYIRPRQPGTRPAVGVLREQEGLPRPSIQALACTDGHRVWCATPDGLYTTGMDGDGRPLRAQRCYSAEAFRMNASLPLSDGRILWAGDGRLTVNPSAAEGTSPLPEHHVLISRSGEGGEYSATLCLPDIALTDKIRFRYRMDGGAWQEAGTERRLPLGRLAAGTHQMETIACFVGDGRTNAPAVATLIRVPLPWSAIAAWAGLLLLPVLSGGLLLIRRKKRLRKKAPPASFPDTPDTDTQHRPAETPAAGSLEKTAAPLAETDKLLTERTATPPEADRSLTTERTAPLTEADKLLTERAAEAVERLMQDPGLDKNRLAQELCMSPSTLYRRLKPATGMSPNEYIRHRRLLRARRLLQAGHTVSETAALVGMSVTYLGRCYKEEFGISPSEVRP